MEMQTLTELLHEKNCSCVVGNGEIRIFSHPGVIDLYDLLCNDRHFLIGAAVADRVVGKAAAALMIVGGVRRVHAGVISRQAFGLLENYGVEVGYGEMAEFILNSDRTDACPLDKLCSDGNDPVKILGIIDGFITSKTSGRR